MSAKTSITNVPALVFLKSTRNLVSGNWRSSDFTDHPSRRAAKIRRTDCWAGREASSGFVASEISSTVQASLKFVMGRGCFTAERTIEVALDGGGTRTLRGHKVFLDVGAFATLPALLGLAEAAPLTHVELLDLDTVPEHLLILAGSYVGLELAQTMRRLGSRVTVCGRDERLLPREDRDIAEAALHLLQDEGIAIVTSARVDRVCRLPWVRRRTPAG